MIVRDVPREEVERLAATVDLQVQWRKVRAEGDEVGATAHPTPGSTRWLVTDSGYRGGKSYCCIHGYAALIEAVLRAHPDATVVTTNTDYLGLEDYEQRQPQVMAQLERRFGREICTCDTRG